jgi:aurora kinase
MSYESLVARDALNASMMTLGLGVSEILTVEDASDAAPASPCAAPASPCSASDARLSHVVPPTPPQPHRHELNDSGASSGYGGNETASAGDASAPPGAANASGQQRIRQEELSDDAFVRGGVVGRGASSTVYAATHAVSGSRVALKEIELWRIRDAARMKNLVSEINVHRTVRHPHIVRLYSYYRTPESIVLVMELGEEGTLADLHSSWPRKRCPSEHMAAMMVRQIAKALAHLHALHVVHRDLKLENVLVVNGTLKLADFGVARELVAASGTAAAGSARSSAPSRATVCGTLDYLSPEMVQQQRHTSKTDVWSLGVLAAELLVGEPPFYHESTQRTMAAIREDRPRLPSALSAAGADLLHRMMAKDPQARPTIEEALAHPWLAKRPALATKAGN